MRNDSVAFETARFELPDAPAVFRPITWEAEFSPGGIKRLSLMTGTTRGELTRAGELRRPVEKRLKEVKKKLLSRLKGARADFDWDEFDLHDAGPFHKKVWRAMQNIPFGETATYGDVAREAGSPLAFRACGQACGANRIVIFIPCHRVVGSNGIGGFGCGLEWKKRFLEMEKKK